MCYLRIVRFVLCCAVFLVCLPAIASAGVPTLWVDRHNGPGSGMDQAMALAIAGSGDVYVTGSSSRYGSSAYDIATIRYAPDGAIVWEHRFSPDLTLSFWPTDIAVDGDGNVCVTGQGYGWSGIAEYDYVTLKLDADGNLLWDRRYDGAGGQGDRANSLALDAGGNLYVTGHTFIAEGNYDFTTLKYDPAGTLLWERSYDGPAGGVEQGARLVADATGNVVVSGWSQDVDGVSVFATLKYDTDGALLWERRYRTGDDIHPRAVILAANGNVYIAGCETGVSGPAAAITVAYAADGALLWDRSYGGTAGVSAAASGIQVDAAGAVYVAGAKSVLVSDSDFLLLKYDSSGTLLWERSYDVAAGRSDGATACTIDDAGNVYLTGPSTDVSPDIDFATVKYDPNGNLLWAKRYDGPDHLADSPTDLALDLSGNLYVTGGSYTDGQWSDYLTIKYGASACNCPYRGDFDQSGGVDAIDLGKLIDIVFYGSPDLQQDPDCPNLRSDFNADGVLDAVDLGGFIDHIFFNGPAPVAPCGP